MSTVTSQDCHERTELEKTLAHGLYGTPELKHDEKIYYLGEFRERVIKMLYRRQVVEPGIYPEIVTALKTYPAKLIINGVISNTFTEKYQRVCTGLGKKYSVVHDPKFKGEAGLVVVSDHAEDIEDITVPDRNERLKSLGLPENLIALAGSKVCKRCLAMVLDADPEENINYRELTVGDRFWGEHCPACVVKKE